MEKIMMSRVREVLRLRFATNLSIRQSAISANVSRSTASDYCKRFELCGMDIVSFLLLDETKQERLLFATPTPKPTSTRPLPDVEDIHRQLQLHKRDNLTLMLLWEEYKLAHPNGYGYTQFGDYYRRYKATLNPSMRQVHIPGDKLFVDYSGLTIPIVDSTTGEITKAQIFVAVLGASGYTFVHATPSQRREDFILSHTLAFEFFGGTPRIVVPDNLKSAVTYNNKQGILINESYADLAKHYSMAVEPARPYKPKDKAKAEQGVLGIQRWILMKLRGRTFFDVNELNSAISLLLDGYNNKIVKRFDKSRTQLFLELDKPYLQRLPANRYTFKEFKRATVNQDYHIALEKCFYSVPYKYLKHIVELRYSTAIVEIYHKNKLIAQHPKLHRIGDVSTLSEHMPSSHQYQNEKMNPDRLRAWAKKIGEDASLFVESQLTTTPHPPNAYRKIIAILSLEKLYTKEALNLAIAYGVKHGTLYTKSIKSILDKKLYLQEPINTNESKQQPKSLGNHENLRGNIYS
jgi:transposase